MPTTPDDFNPERIDRDIRLNEAWHEADAMARRKVAEGGLTGEEAEKAIECWRNLYSLDTAPLTSQNQILRAEGIDITPPDELDDAALTAKLWEVIRAMAERNTFLSNTDHLSDRALYTFLVEEAFNEITWDMVAPGWNHHIDVLGSGSEEDIELSMRYYADDEERARWAQSWPDFKMPPKEKPPYNRDRLLPKAKYE